MPALARIALEDVERALGQAQAERVRVAYEKGRVVGLARVRELAGGGDHHRIRSMVIELLAKRGARIPAGELKRASEILGKVVAAGPRQPLVSERSIRSMLRTFEMIVRSRGDLRGLFPAMVPVVTGTRMAGVVAPPSEEMIQKDDGAHHPPAGDGRREARNGAGRKPMMDTPGSSLSAMRQRRDERALPETVEFNPFDMEAVTRRRAATKRVNRDGNDQPS